jgi:DNA-binding transcriptional ArsR family regulator
MPNPIDLMFNKQRRAALGLLYSHPTERFYVREISRLTGVAAGSLHRELRLLSRAGLLVRRHNGNNVYYQADTSSQLFPELTAIFHKTNDLRDILRDCIMPLGDRVAAAFVFYPRVNGRVEVGGCVNLFVIGSVSEGEVVVALRDVTGPQKIKINLDIMRADEFSTRMEQGDSFVTGIMQGQKMFVKGFS